MAIGQVRDPSVRQAAPPQANNQYANCSVPWCVSKVLSICERVKLSVDAHSMSNRCNRWAGVQLTFIGAVQGQSNTKWHAWTDCFVCPTYPHRREAVCTSHIRPSGAVALRVRTVVSTPQIIARLGIRSFHCNARVRLELLLAWIVTLLTLLQNNNAGSSHASAHADNVPGLSMLPTSGTRKMMSSAFAKPGGTETGSIAVIMWSPKRTSYGPECRSNVSMSAWRVIKLMPNRPMALESWRFVVIQRAGQPAISHAGIEGLNQYKAYLQQSEDVSLVTVPNYQSYKKLH